MSPEHVADTEALLAEVDRLTARVAELEEAARFRPASEAPPQGERILVNRIHPFSKKPLQAEIMYHDPAMRYCWRSDKAGHEDAEILGWRPLSPGPEVSK